MKVETALPLGRLVTGMRTEEQDLDPVNVDQDARAAEGLGYDTLTVRENKHDPFIVVALASQATTRVGLATSVAIAFPRSPMVTAMSAWTLQKLSNGRFTLGLGPQVKGHIERRFGLRWSAAAPWMAEYLQALRAIWDCWQSGSRLDVRGDHYNINLMVPLFNPGPIEHPGIPIHIAAVNPAMCKVAGRLADGVRPHPMCTAEYISQMMLPAVREGADKAGRTLAHYAVAVAPLIATGLDQKTLDARINAVRGRIAFYASTPAYRAALEFHGLGDLADRLATLSRAQRWDEMPRLITDDVLEKYAVVARHHELVQKLSERYRSVVTHLEFSIPVATEQDAKTLRTMIAALQAQKIEALV